MYASKIFGSRFDLVGELLMVHVGSLRSMWVHFVNY